MKSWPTKLVPESVKSRIRQSKYCTRLRAKQLARRSKRLDLCAAQIAHLLHVAEYPSVKDKVCVELGSGWVLSHAIVFHLLGAKKVIATDVSPLAQPSFLSEAIHFAVPYMVRDILSPFCEHSEIRRRLDNLLSIEYFSFDVLKRIGVEYIAPKDFAKTPLGIPFDFVYSFSVLEHVPVEDVPSLLRNLAKDLREGGIMLHAIHLEDHKSTSNSPFAFLSETQDSFPRSVQAERGNRMRRSQWLDLLYNVKDLDFRFIYEWSRLDKKLPEAIDPSISCKGEDDMRISHIGLLGTKKRTDQESIVFNPT